MISYLLSESSFNYAHVVAVKLLLPHRRHPPIWHEASRLLSASSVGEISREDPREVPPAHGEISPPLQPSHGSRGDPRRHRLKNIGAAVVKRRSTSDWVLRRASITQRRFGEISSSHDEDPTAHRGAPEISSTAMMEIGRSPS
ncbi:hypothetical protein L484_028026 [Morus notabilis]|uniref:Uncharacterized protein n=1 Tax=Morus notabilis TaxID=981085 RepID=W9SW91_9ROSA|nr:hypothetical protein L484_028026 [Morus notabilis]